MPQLTVRNVDSGTIDRLKSRATAHGRSLEAELRDILRQAAGEPATAGRPGPARHSDSKDSVRLASPGSARPQSMGGLDLPVPTAEEVARYRELYEENYGVSLSEEEAWDSATRFLHLVYLATLQPPGSDG